MVFLAPNDILQNEIFQIENWHDSENENAHVFVMILCIVWCITTGLCLLNNLKFVLHFWHVINFPRYNIPCHCAFEMLFYVKERKKNNEYFLTSGSFKSKNVQRKELDDNFLSWCSRNDGIKREKSLAKKKEILKSIQAHIFFFKWWGWEFGCFVVPQLYRHTIMFNCV